MVTKASAVRTPAKLVRVGVVVTSGIPENGANRKNNHTGILVEVRHVVAKTAVQFVAIRELGLVRAGRIAARHQKNALVLAVNLLALFKFQYLTPNISVPKPRSD